MELSREDVIRLAREAEFQEGWCNLWAENFALFAHLAIADFLASTGQYVTNDASREAALAQARAAEREAIRSEIVAKELQGRRVFFSPAQNQAASMVAESIDAAIRARGNP